MAAASRSSPMRSTPTLAPRARHPRQQHLTRRYQAVYSSTTLMLMAMFVQEAVLAMSKQQIASEAWRLMGTVGISSVVYCGEVVSWIGCLMRTTWRRGIPCLSQPSALCP